MGWDPNASQIWYTLAMHEPYEANTNAQYIHQLKTQIAELQSQLDLQESQWEIRMGATEQVNQVLKDELSRADDKNVAADIRIAELDSDLNAIGELHGLFMDEIFRLQNQLIYACGVLGNVLAARYHGVNIMAETAHLGVKVLQVELDSITQQIDEAEGSEDV